MTLMIYMYIESIDSLIMVDTMSDTTLKDAWDRCTLYFNKNPHDYLIYDEESNQWFIYTTTEYYLEEVA